MVAGGTVAHGGGWEEERSTWKRREETNPPPSPLRFPFFCPREERGRSVYGRARGREKERKIKRPVPDAVQKLERERRGRWKGVEA